MPHNKINATHRDPWTGGSANAAARALLATGAACHVLLLGSENTEALTGPAAVKRAVTNILTKKVSDQNPNSSSHL